LPSKHSAGPGLEVIEHRESLLLAPYATHSSQSKGRKYQEFPQSYRGPFQRDRDRIIHTAAYRRLSHKTQVFTNQLGDYHRNRLTHTLEVCSIARTVARAIRLNEDLVEAMALMHDIGHPPFGHSGEDALRECLKEQGGFSHNQHALRIVEELESPYPEFSGLNLSYETLEGQRYRAEKQSMQVCPSLEAQVVDAADSIAYNSHDADDALELDLLDIDHLLEVPMWRAAADRVQNRTAVPSKILLRRAVIHELIDWQVQDLLQASVDRMAQSPHKDLQDAKNTEFIILQSVELSKQKQELEGFLFNHVYQHPNVLAVRDHAQSALHEMFDKLVRHIEFLPESYRRRAEESNARRSVCDYLAGMTDRFAWREHQRLCGP
jgi:dGTPase